jgi:hypothetical protein
MHNSNSMDHGSGRTTGPDLSGPGLVPAMWVVRICVIYTLFWVVIWCPLNRAGIDYPKHWEAARALIEGKSVYRGGHLWIEFNYPQAMAFNFAWLGLLDFTLAEKLWKLFLGSCLVGSWYLAWKVYLPSGFRRGRDAAKWGWIFALILGLYQPAINSLAEGNIDAYNALLIVLMTALILTGREYMAGLVWGLLISVKLLPVVLIIPFLIWRKSKILYGAGIFLAVYLVLLLLAGRLGEEWYYLTKVLPFVPDWWRHGSVSFIHLVFSWLGLEDRYITDPYFCGIWSRGFLFAIMFIYICILVVLKARGKPFLAGIESAVIIFPLLSPLFWYHHLVWILPVMLLQFSDLVQGRYGRLMGAGLISGWLLIQAPYLILRHFPIDPIWKDYGYLAGYLTVTLLTVVSTFSHSNQAKSVEPEAGGLHHQADMGAGREHEK